MIFSLIYTGYQANLKNERLKIELQAAHDAQMFIMPHGDPQVDGLDISGISYPAHEVGGDFFEYFWLDKEKLNFGIAVGDVSGKAMNSAMTAVLTSGMISLSSEENTSIKDILTRLNRTLFRKTDSRMFTALALLSFNTKTKNCVLSNAGMNEPLLKSQKSVTYIQSIEPKFPLGIQPNTIYNQQEINISKNDIFIVFTDGISDAQNKNKQFYGFDRLSLLLKKIDTSSLSSLDIKQKIIEDVNRFSEGMQQFDDMTAVVIKIL